MFTRSNVKWPFSDPFSISKGEIYTMYIWSFIAFNNFFPEDLVLWFWHFKLIPCSKMCLLPEFEFPYTQFIFKFSFATFIQPFYDKCLYYEDIAKLETPKSTTISPIFKMKLRPVIFKTMLKVLYLCMPGIFFFLKNWSTIYLLFKCLQLQKQPNFRQNIEKMSVWQQVLQYIYLKLASSTHLMKKKFCLQKYKNINLKIP